MAMFDVDPGLLAGLKEPDEQQKRKLLGGLLNMDPDSPEAQGLLGMAAQMLQASGPSRTPVGFGQALGSGFQGMQQGRANATKEGFMRQQLQGEQGQQEMQRKLMEAKIGAMNNPSGANMQDEASIKRYLFRQGLPPGEARKTFDDMIRAQQFLNLGDRQVGIGIGGGVTSTLPVNLKPGERPDVKAAQTTAVEDAKRRGEGEAGLNSALDDINKMRNDINGLIKSPGFSTIYGLSGKLDPRSYIPGTDAAGSGARLQQLDAASFGMSIQKMKGMGSLSDAEGKKVAAAYTRATNPKISEDDAKTAWNEVLGYLDLAEKRAKERAGMSVPDKNQMPPSANNTGGKPITVDW